MLLNELGRWKYSLYFDTQLWLRKQVPTTVNDLV